MPLVIKNCMVPFIFFHYLWICNCWLLTDNHISHRFSKDIYILLHFICSAFNQTHFESFYTNLHYRCCLQHNPQLKLSHTFTSPSSDGLSECLGDEKSMPCSSFSLGALFSFFTRGFRFFNLASNGRENDDKTTNQVSQKHGQIA